MTREEAKQAVEVLKAFADGKKIEFCNKVGVDYWKCNDNADCVNFNFARYSYRIAKEPQFRPFKDAEECWNEMLKHKPFGWIKRNYNGDFVSMGIIDDTRDYESMLKYNTFADGEPFGVKIE